MISYIAVVTTLWAVVATERAFYYNFEYRYKECEYCGKISYNVE